MDIMIVGEAWGEREEEEGMPFVGPTGWYLDQMLDLVGIRRSECYLTSVFNLRPRPTNDVKNLCGPKAEGIPGLPALTSGKYVRAEYEPELQRLYREISNVNPNVILALGNSATWALTRKAGIRKQRGAATLAHAETMAAVDNPDWLGKVIPSYHPSAMMRDMTLRPTLMADIEKAKRESTFPDLRRPQREIWTFPTLSDIEDFYEQYIKTSSILSIDIETKANQITCIGFAPSHSVALVVPFYDPTQKDGNYWRTSEAEIIAWTWVRMFCGLRRRIIFQNGLYDMHFLWRGYGIKCPYASDDTMLLHHALQPELEKGLGYLGTIYTDEAQWKFMRTKHDTVKKED